MGKAKDGLYVDGVGDIAFVRGGWYVWARISGLYLNVPPAKGELDYPAVFRTLKPFSKDLNTW